LIKRVSLKLIGIYQYISALTPASCRYYPTCSEYAKWQFKFNRFDKALLSSILRILRCNQLFKGGIDYPAITFNPPSPLGVCNHKEEIEVKYWLVPKDKNMFYIVKTHTSQRVP